MHIVSKIHYEDPMVSSALLAMALHKGLQLKKILFMFVSKSRVSAGNFRSENLCCQEVLTFVLP